MKVKAFTNSKKNRAFADHLLLAIMISMLLDGDQGIDPELMLNTYGGRSGNVDDWVCTVGSKVSPQELAFINDKIVEGQHIDFKNTYELMEHCKTVFGLNDCQCVEAIACIHWDYPLYRHNKQKS